LWTTLLAPDPEDPTSPTRELDERWTLVLKTANDSWIGMALCRKSRQGVAYAVGDRSTKTCQRWWEAYAALIPKEQQTAVGKETEETAHVERWNTTRRQPLARFVHRMWSFSMSVIMPEACLLLFVHRYQTERAILLK
jgi:IS1 family transposase